MAVRDRSIAHARASARRRRGLVLALTIASVAVFFVKGRSVPVASARAPARAPVASRSPAAQAPRTVVRAAPAKPPVRATPSLASSPSPSPSPTPDGPPFVLDAAPSCAGSTALIDVQVAATVRRPIVKLELVLDGTVVALTPVPGYPMTQYAGRSSGHASLSGAGEWVLRATDKKGIVEAQPFPYACA